MARGPSICELLAMRSWCCRQGRPADHWNARLKAQLAEAKEVVRESRRRERGKKTQA